MKAQNDGTMEQLSVSQARQIAGRAGRFNTAYAEGEVTCLRREDMASLKHLLCDALVTDDVKAGLHPTFEQIEMFK